MELTNGYWDPTRCRGWAVHLLGAWPWVWCWEDNKETLRALPCPSEFTVTSLTDLRKLWSLGRDVWNAFLLSPFPVFGSTPEFRVQLCFQLLGKPGGLWSPKVESIPLDGTCGISTAVLHGITPYPWWIALWGTLGKSLSFRLQVRQCLKGFQSLTFYSSRSSNTLPSWNVLAIEASSPWLLFGFFCAKTLAVQWGVPDDWIWNVYSLESSEVGTSGKKKCHQAVLEKFSSIRGEKNQWFSGGKTKKHYHVPRWNFITVLYLNAQISQMTSLGTLRFLEWCSRVDKNRWCSTINQIFWSKI